MCFRILANKNIYCFYTYNILTALNSQSTCNTSGLFSQSRFLFYRSPLSARSMLLNAEWASVVVGRPSCLRRTAQLTKLIEFYKNKIHTIVKSNSYKVIIDKLLPRHGRIWFVAGELSMQKSQIKLNKKQFFCFSSFIMFYWIKICFSLCSLPLLYRFIYFIFYLIFFSFHSPLLHSELCLLTDFGNWTIKKWIFDESFPTFSSSLSSFSLSLLLRQRSCSPFTVAEIGLSQRGS